MVPGRGDGLLFYSLPDATRLRNIAANSRVAFNLRGDPQGDTIVTCEGRLAVDREAPGGADHSGYVSKYGSEIVRLGWTAHTFSDLYSVLLRLTLTRVRAWG